jgi:hypothetical protein
MSWLGRVRLKPDTKYGDAGSIGPGANLVRCKITMASDNILRWRPKGPPQPVGEPELLWTMVKQRWQIDCTLQNFGRHGWSLHVLLNGSSFFRSRFRSWEDAIEGAEDKYAELVRGGWAPVPLNSTDRPFSR